jgi:hypothetical protein
MARPHAFASSRATITAAFFGIALLAVPLGCGSSSEDDTDDTASEPDDSPSQVPPRDQRPAANETPASNAADDDEPPANPAPMDPPNVPDEAPAAPGAGADGSNVVPAAAAAAFASCTRSEGSYGTNCDYVFVTMTQASPERCVQLTIDNCGDGYTNGGLPVDVPLTWQLSSATIGSSPSDCELGAFDPESTIVIDASGSISWGAVVGTALPSGIVLDVTLEPSRTAEDQTSIDVVTTEPLNPVRCAD